MLHVRHKPTREKIEVIEHWLDKSGQLPLTIRIYIANNGDGTDDADDSGKLFRDFANLFNKHSERWQTLSIQSRGWISELFIGNQNGAPLLETLQPIVLRHRDNRPGTQFKLVGLAPHPKCVEAVGYHRLPSIDISWSSVTDVTVNHISLADCLSFIHNSPQLVSLRLQNINLGMLDANNPPPTTVPFAIIHHHLRTLMISADSEGTFTAFMSMLALAILFSSMTLPCLDDDTIYSDDQSGVPYNFGVVEAFLTRSSPPLTTLNLTVRRVKKEALDFLYKIPSSVQNLRLDLSSDGEDFHGPIFDHLSRDPTVVAAIHSQSELLPNLETFTYDVDSECGIPWNRLPKLLRPHSGRERPLKTIITILQHPRSQQSSNEVPPLLINRSQNMEESTVRSLIGLQDDGVELYLPRKISRGDLLALL